MITIIVEEQEFYGARLGRWYLRYVYLRYATFFGLQRWMYVN